MVSFTDDDLKKSHDELVRIRDLMLRSVHQINGFFNRLKVDKSIHKFFDPEIRAIISYQVGINRILKIQQRESEAEMRADIARRQPGEPASHSDVFSSTQSHDRRVLSQRQLILGFFKELHAQLQRMIKNLNTLTYSHSDFEISTRDALEAEATRIDGVVKHWEKKVEEI